MLKTAMITGGAGFIGSHLCGFLLEKGYRVVCMDNLVTGSKKNIEEFQKNENFSFVEHDVTNPIEMEESIDEIYYLASPASPIDYIKLPLQTMLANSVGVKNVLDIARVKNSKFLVASTSEIYGDPLKHPQNEDYWGNVNPIGPRACYDESKRFAETITTVYRRQFRLNTYIARIFNTYGPKMRKNDGRVIPNFIVQALNGEALTVYGDGSHTRSFCFVNDLIEGLYLLMQSGVHSPVNIGNPREFKILDLAEKIKKATNANSEIVFKDLPEDDPVRRRPDIKKAKEELKWEPKVSLEAGLKKTIEWFKNQK